MNSAQYVPIFVGSTHMDLKEHRAKVKDTLTRMETFVHGMEQFGARDESPVETCLAEVRKCKLYIGIIAMRYGSIPDGHDKSMTELEYDEAQRLGLPSYIFILDEQNGFINPASIDFENHEKLKAFKEKLKKKTIEFFTTPDDLANKVGSAIHRALKDGKVGAVAISPGIETVIKPAPVLSGKTILRRFEVLPQRWTGVDLSLDIDNFIIDDSPMPSLIDIKEADETDCCAFGLDKGNAICTRCNIHGLHKDFLFVAEGDNAYALIDTDFYATFKILGETMSYYAETYHDLVLAIKIKKIIGIERVYLSENPDIPF